jgi:hypothetical protein
MIFATSIISGQEWIRFREAAQQLFSNEVLARGEIMRRRLLGLLLDRTPEGLEVEEPLHFRSGEKNIPRHSPS